MSARRPVLMTLDLAEVLGLLSRIRLVDARTGVVRLGEEELLVYGASRVEWGKPDSRGYYTPTIWADQS